MVAPKSKLCLQNLGDLCLYQLLRSQREEESKRRLIVLLEEVEEVGSDGRMHGSHDVTLTLSLPLLQILSKNVLSLLTNKQRNCAARLRESVCKFASANPL